MNPGTTTRGRVLRPDDVPEIADLFERVFGRRISAEHYRWKLRNRPSPADNVSIAVDQSDRPVFHIGGIPCRCRIAGSERWVMVAVDAMTAAPERRRGLYTTHASELFARWKTAGVALVLGMPNENHGSRIQALGWRPLASLTWLLLPLRPERIVAQKFGVPLLARLRFVGNWWRRMVFRNREDHCEVGVREVRELNADFDRLWARASLSVSHSLVRDRAWVTWRYLDEPAGRYRVLLATRGSEIVGYIAYSVAGSRTMTIAEVFTMPGDAIAFAALVRGAIQTIADEVDSVRTLAAPGTWAYQEFRRLGFFRRRHSFRVEYIPLDPLLGDRDVGTARDWYLTGGDFDVV